MHDSRVCSLDGIRAMPSARALLVASLLTEPPYGVSALRVTIAIANVRFARKQRGASQVNCQGRGGSFAMNRPPANVSGRRYWMIHRNDPYSILSQIAASTESLLAWKLGPGNQRQRRAG
jgi:hypothetical protein